VIAAHHAGRDVRVLIPEGRPGLFGARISCWELAGAGMSNVLVPDAAAAGIVAAGGIDAVLILADRIAVNGDVGGAAGSFGLAAAARHRGIPFLVCATVGSLDPATATGADIVVGSRDVPELAAIGVEAHAPRSTEVVAPRDDVVPAALVSDYVGASGLGLPPFPAIRPIAADVSVGS
jgi:methylthioribose-1-phosphate isomerase